LALGLPVLAAVQGLTHTVAVAAVAAVVAEEMAQTARLLEEKVVPAVVEVAVEPKRDLITVILMAHLLLVALVVRMAVFVLFTPVLHDHSHQQTQVICNGTFYSYC